jgi:hypothetical protein
LRSVFIGSFVSIIASSGLVGQETDPQDDRSWAFRPPSDPVVPGVGDGEWPASDLDRFVLARLESQGLRPAPPADRRTLVRRVTLDLTGIPPTPAEVDAFLSDDSPAAWERLVDRLLASPRYGERWGRHWLDVARYADSNGLDENVALANAWRYRDWVVRAFGQDLPFARFLTDQLAGDLIDGSEDARREALIATGFLSLGPKVLAEGDERKMEMDIIDEQVDTVGRAFLALTIGCARCHDHKFDPISSADYYALAGIFKSTKTMDSFQRIAKWHENTIASEAAVAERTERERRAKELEGLVEKLEAEEKEPATSNPERVRRLEDSRAELTVLRQTLASELDSAPGVVEGQAANLRVHVRGSHLDLGPEVARGLPAVLGRIDIPTSSSGRLELARDLTRRDHPLTARVFVNRVWRWHFGSGLVRTTDNFGSLGEQATDAPLLDWLASRFVDDSGSIKALHRRILGSSTYRMSSVGETESASKAAAIDPANELLWCFPSRRIEAEVLRDSLLAVSDLLDLTVGGPSITHVKNREFLFDHTSKDTTRYESRRRSLYLPVIRNHLYDAFELFDYPDPAVSNGDRSTTTVPSQSLFLLNGDLVLDAAGALASEIAREGLDGVRRVEELYRRALGRPPTDTELARSETFLSRYRDVVFPETPDDAAKVDHAALAALAQALLVSNEFVYLP